jgi:DNA helicase TIP49 (TBP-interacting protein)
LLSGDRNQIMDRMKQQGLELTEQQLGELKNLDQQEALRYLTELAR